MEKEISRVIHSLNTDFLLLDRISALVRIIPTTRDLFSCKGASFLLDDDYQPGILKHVTEKTINATDVRFRSAKEFFELSKGRHKKRPTYYGPKAIRNSWLKELSQLTADSHFLIAPIQERRQKTIAYLLLENDLKFSNSARIQAYYLAHQIGPLIESLRVSEIGQLLLSSGQSIQRMDKLASTILRHACALMRSDFADLALWSDITGTLKKTGGSFVDDFAELQEWTDVEEGSFISTVWSSALQSYSKQGGRITEELDAMRVSSVRSEKNSCSSSGVLGKSEIAVTIQAEEKPIGVLNIRSVNENFFDEQDTRSLKLIAKFVSIAIRSKSSSPRAWSVNRTEQQPIPATTRQALREILRCGMTLTNSQAGVVILLDEKQRIKEAIGASNRGDKEGVTGSELQACSSIDRLATKAFNHESPLTLLPPEYKKILSESLVKKLGVESVLHVLPLCEIGFGNKVKGVGLVLFWNGLVKRFLRDDACAFLQKAFLDTLTSTSLESTNNILPRMNLKSVVRHSHQSAFDEHALRMLAIGLCVSGFRRMRVFDYNAQSNRFHWRYQFDLIYGFQNREFSYAANSNKYSLLCNRFPDNRKPIICDPNNPLLYRADPFHRVFDKEPELCWIVFPVVSHGHLLGKISADNESVERSINPEQVSMFDNFVALASLQVQRSTSLQSPEDAYEDRFANLVLKTLPVVTWIKDCDHRFLSVNKLFLDTIPRLLTWSKPMTREDVIGKTDFDVFPEHLARNFRDGDLEAIRKGTFTDEGEPLGSSERVHVIKRALVRGGDVIGTQGAFVNVTDFINRRWFDESPIGFIELDRTGTVLYANKTMASLTPVSFKGKQLWDLVTRRDEAESKLKTFLVGQSPSAVFTFKLRNTGTYARFICSLRKRGTDEVSGVLCVVVTAQLSELMEQSLKHPDPRYLEQMMNLDVPVFRKNMEFEYVEANQAFLNQIGCSEFATIRHCLDKDLIEQFGFKKSLAEPILKSFRESDQKALAGAVVTQTGPQIWKGGMIGDAFKIKFPVRNSEQEIIGIQGVYWPLEENDEGIELMRKAWDKSKEEYRNIVADMPQGVYKAGFDGRFVSVNKAMASIFGFASTGEMIEKCNLFSLVPIQNEALRELSLKALIKGEHIERRIKWQYLTIAGRSIWVSEVARKVNSEAGQGYIEGMVEDITAIVQNGVILEEGLHRVRNDYLAMEGIVQHTIDSIKGRTESIDFTQELRKIRDRSSTIRLINEQLLATSVVTDVGLRRYVHSLFKLVRERSVKEFDFSFAMDGEMTLKTDVVAQIGRMLNELVSNSIEHSGVEDAKLKIDLTIRAIATGTLKIEVKDNGFGFPHDFSDRLNQSRGWSIIQGVIAGLNGQVQRYNSNGAVVAVYITDLKFLW